MQNDVLAGLAVGVMAVPQCVSFALMAGLPSAYGLYSATVPIIAYAFTGTSPQLVYNTSLASGSSEACKAKPHVKSMLTIHQHPVAADAVLHLRWHDLADQVAEAIQNVVFDVNVVCRQLDQ